MTTKRTITLTSALIAALSTPAVLAAPASASGGGGDVRASGHCTNGTGVWKLKAKHDSGAVEIEFEVDTNRVGQAWNVALRDNGSAVFARTVHTVAPSGSFTVHARTANRAGMDTVGARAVRGTRVCAGTVRL